ncbi:zf-HC2 domain-containing protein [Paenibacillus sp.]|uniref:anti-sigma factor family protein n=1 Tax=Paenibacillus sp. TaxID=58172 RepID=UPI002811631E|nr:zf-HC2 domain-containing protein [Paenibacillus sp.]
MELMQRHLDGDLNYEEQKQLSEHLDACPECTDMMERLERIDQDLASLPKVTPAYSLVDAIMPRLAQIDAASESMSAREAAPRGAAVRPWYARGAFARYGGLAAAAAVLGVLVVNGMTGSFEKSANQAQESAASGGASADMMMSMEAPLEEAVADGAATKRSASEAEAPAADASPSMDNAADPNASVSSTPEPSKAPKDGDDTAAGSGETPAAPPPSPSREPQPAAAGGGTDGAEGVGVMGFEGPAEEGAAPESEAPKEAAEMPPAEEEPTYGIARDQAFEDGARGKGSVPGLLSEDGTFAAAVELKEDGTQVVVVNELEGDADYASSYAWAAETAVELIGWDGATLTYTATTEGVARTFRIDAASATETEIE